jgi:signal transduction histidine kinase
MEGFIDDYGRVRLAVAIAVLAFVAGVVLTGGSIQVASVYTVGFLVVAIHAGWSLTAGAEVRRPRLVLLMDMSLVGFAASVAAFPGTAGISLAVWCVLITFLTYGISRWFFYAYAVLWYLLRVRQASPDQDLTVSIAVIFGAAIVVLILLTVNRRMLMLESHRSQLLGSVSHELRNQLTGVIGMIDLALDQSPRPSPDEMRDLIGLARREAMDAADVIEDLLTASRMESNVLDFELETVDLDLEVGQMVEHYPEEGRSIQYTPPGLAGLVLADRVRLRQILRNLLSNAVHHGGKTIAVSVTYDANTARVRVADNGPGVPSGEEANIFLPYRRAANTRRHQSSVGLGLWISRRLARGMGGDLAYRREDGQTIFELSLAMNPSAPASATPVAVAEF